MTVRDDFDRLLVVWLDETAGAGTPDYLDETLDGLATVGQRPAWMSPGRWLPMLQTMPRVAIPRAVPILAVIALLIAALVVAALIVGSRQQRLPPPFGLAATGVFAFDSGGDVYVANPDGTGIRPLVSGPGEELGATFSRDGTHIAYWSIPPAGSPELWVSLADGLGARKVSGDVVGPRGQVGPAADWSPTGDMLAFAAFETIHVVKVDGTGLRTVSTAPGAFGPTWAPDGTSIAFTSSAGGTTSVYVVDADGSNERQVSESPGFDLSHLWPSRSGDSAAVLYSAGTGLDGDIYLARRNATSWTETILIDGKTNDLFPEWSTDGTRISFHRALPIDHGQVVVVDADGGNERPLDTRLIGIAPHCWTPDDARIVAVTAQQDKGIGDEPDPGFVVIDVKRSEEVAFIPAPDRAGFAACSLQRLALE
jgi:TolB protein